MRVFVTCSGLGHVNRGYESFAREVFDTLLDDNQLEMFLFKGAGKNSAREKALFNLHRRGSFAQLLARWTGKDAYFFEEVSFVLALLPYLLWLKPGVILLSDHRTCVFLFKIRALFGLKYKLLFSNGAPNGPPFSFCDHVQQLLPSLHKQAIAGGEDPLKHSILPYGIKVPHSDAWPSDEQKEATKTAFGIPLKKKIVLSVGAINSHHKRMDYLVEEFSKLPTEDYFLLVLGSMEEESKTILDLAEARLAKGSYLFKSVPYSEVVAHYQLSDLFVLCSLAEGFGRVYLEALMQGLPVLSHDYPVAREVMGNSATYLDLKKEGALAQAISQVDTYVDKQVQRDFVFQHYDWSILKNKYKEMIGKI